jgi:hypothetical protein
VREDWCAWLPDSKARLNENCSKELEALYLMLSVSLDEALDLRRKGALAKSFEAAQIASGLCERLAQSLKMVLGGLHRHAKYFGLIPNAAPLDPANFQGTRGQRTARLTGLLNRVLFSQRSRFIHKVSTLLDMVDDLKQDFCDAVEELVNGFHSSTEALWNVLDQSHFDLNTCLREAIVLLKSFLLVLPEEQLISFETELRFPHSQATQHSLSFRHRRFVAVPGK